jgi:CHAT domain-containing protein
LGKEVKGEGLMSLIRAVMYAGTPSVMASLWNVDDKSTADSMIQFYRYLTQGKKQGARSVKLSKAEALREAQLQAIRVGALPYHWAPFILVGKS